MTQPYHETAGGELLIPLFETPERQAYLHKIGYVATIALRRDGTLIHDQLAFCFVRQTPYTLALEDIYELEKAGAMDQGEYEEAFALLVNGEFDSSPYAAFLTDGGLDKPSELE